jgi:glycosyltransferase involved in cell wall biosynthesis
MKKVIVFRKDLLPSSETFIKEQARFLRHWQPVLVGYDRVKNGLDLGGLEVKIIDGVAIKAIGRYALRLRQMLGRAHRPTVDTLRAIDAHLVHVHFGTDATDIWPSVKAVGLPMVVTLHGYDINIHRQWWESGHGGIHRRLYPRRLLNMAQEPAVHFIAVSHAIKLRAIEYGIPESKITVCYIGVDTERFKLRGLPLDQRRKRILFVGRMVEKKAPLLLIRAFSEVVKQVPDAELVVIGDGPLLKDAQQMAQDLGLPVEFFGAQNSDVVLTELNQARVLCLPSVTAENGDAEGFGLVVLEAQASGVPVVTSARGGASEGVLDRCTGYIFEERDLYSMVQGLLGLVGTGADLVAASSAAVRYVQDHFDVRDCSASLEQIFDRLSAIDRRILRR